MAGGEAERDEGVSLSLDHSVRLHLVALHHVVPDHLIDQVAVHPHPVATLCHPLVNQAIAIYLVPNVREHSVL